MPIGRGGQFQTLPWQPQGPWPSYWATLPSALLRHGLPEHQARLRILGASSGPGPEQAVCPCWPVNERVNERVNECSEFLHGSPPHAPDFGLTALPRSHGPRVAVAGSAPQLSLHAGTDCGVRRWLWPRLQPRGVCPRPRLAATPPPPGADCYEVGGGPEPAIAAQSSECRVW